LFSAGIAGFHRETRTDEIPPAVSYRAIRLAEKMMNDLNDLVDSETVIGYLPRTRSFNMATTAVLGSRKSKSQRSSSIASGLRMKPRKPKSDVGRKPTRVPTDALASSKTASKKPSSRIATRRVTTGKVASLKSAASRSSNDRTSRKKDVAVTVSSSESIAKQLPAVPPAATTVPVTANPTGHRMVAQSSVSEDSRRGFLDSALQARARVWMQREVAFIDHPAFRQRDAEAIDDVLAFAATVEDLPLQAEIPDKLPPYLRRLCEVPLLTADDERCLFRRMNFLKFQANVLRMRLREDSILASDLDQIELLVQGAEKIRNRIIRANMRLVMSIVKHYISDSMAFDDLLSEGAAALLRATEKFDCSRGFRFSTYVTKVVRREVFRLVMSHKRQSDRYATGSWDFIGEQSEERSDEVDNEVDLSALRGDLTEFFGNLDPREQAILRARFGMDHDDKAPSLNDLGRRMGVSKERVRQLEMRAIRKLQKQFQQRRAERREAASA
jgi:RNA polymerase sigma factor (sigma-70 family)